jgi:hypothetical protein
MFLRQLPYESTVMCFIRSATYSFRPLGALQMLQNQDTPLVLVGKVGDLYLPSFS